MNINDVTILENGEELTVNSKEAVILERQGLIYICDDKDCGFAHISPDYSWENIDTLLNALRKAEYLLLESLK
jgi:AMMECR1 domain-containing protein